MVGRKKQKKKRIEIKNKYKEEKYYSHLPPRHGKNNMNKTKKYKQQIMYWQISDKGWLQTRSWTWPYLFQSITSPLFQRIRVLLLIIGLARGDKHTVVKKIRLVINFFNQSITYKIMTSLAITNHEGVLTNGCAPSTLLVLYINKILYQ